MISSPIVPIRAISVVIVYGSRPWLAVSHLPYKIYPEFFSLERVGCVIAYRESTMDMKCLQWAKY